MSSETVTPEDVVRRYYRAVGDLRAPEHDLLEVLDPAVRVVEHPNAITPRGAVRGLAETLAGRRAGRDLLAEQEFVLHEVLADGDRVAVRATWTGVVGADRGPLRGGTRLVAHIASLLTVRHGRVVEHETFDCYEPLPAQPPAQRA